MAVSKYFNHVSRQSEQNLFEDLIVEQVKNFGYDIWYIPRNDVEIDRLFGEPVKTIYENAYKIEALIPTAGNLEGMGPYMSKFGIRTQETLQILIAKRRFRELCIPDYIQPKAGDLIFIGDVENPVASFMNDFFEINFVAYDMPGFQLGKQYCYKLMCDSFVFSNEKLETPYDAINIHTLDESTLASVDGEIATPTMNNNTIKQKAAGVVKWNTGNPFGDMDS